MGKVAMSIVQVIHLNLVKHILLQIQKTVIGYVVFSFDIG